MTRLDPVCVENPAAKNTRAGRRWITIRQSEHDVGTQHTRDRRCRLVRRPIAGAGPYGRGHYGGCKHFWVLCGERASRRCADRPRIALTALAAVRPSAGQDPAVVAGEDLA